MSRLTRDGTAEPVSRDQILRHERGRGNIHFSCLGDHVQDWQPYSVDLYWYSCYMCDHTYILGTVFDLIFKFLYIFYSNFTTSGGTLFCSYFVPFFSFFLLLKRGTMKQLKNNK